VGNRIGVTRQSLLTGGQATSRRRRICQQERTSSLQRKATPAWRTSGVGWEAPPCLGMTLKNQTGGGRFQVQEQIPRPKISQRGGGRGTGCELPSRRTARREDRGGSGAASPTQPRQITGMSGENAHAYLKRAKKRENRKIHT